MSGLMGLLINCWHDHVLAVHLNIHWKTIVMRLQFVIFTMAAIISTFVAAPMCLAAPQAHLDAALSFLDATESERRIKSPLEFPSVGIPAIDGVLGALKETPNFKLMRNRTSEVMPTIRTKLAEIYAVKFRETELAALTEFFRSPLGKKYVSLLPELQLAEGKLVIEEVLLKADPKIVEGLEAGKRRQAQAEIERANLEQQAKASNRDAMYRLGTSYCSSSSPSDRKDNLAKCFDWKVRAAEGGLPEAQFDVGFSYIDGRYGNQKSGTEMFKWLKRAADEGHSGAQFYVGSAYAGNTKVFGNQPTGVEVNAKEAEFWLQKAAQAGGMGAIMDLASMYLEGRVVERNIPQSIRWYSMAAEKKNNFAMRKLGEIYESGIDMEPNLTEAMKWYKAAAGVPR